MKLLHASGFSIPEREVFRAFIFSNLIGSMQAILSAMDDHGISLTNPDSEVKITLSIVPSDQVVCSMLTKLPPGLVPDICCLGCIFLCSNMCQYLRRTQGCPTAHRSHHSTRRHSRFSGKTLLSKKPTAWATPTH